MKDEQRKAMKDEPYRFYGRHLSREQLAEHWGCSVRKIDRLRKLRLLPWIDLNAGKGQKPLVRLRHQDIIEFEQAHIMNVKKSKETK